jgi:23S rRNA (adenine1618-N6)-methyltransferase
MKHCFNLLWECPQANLCPRIPSRLNYLIWIDLQIKDIEIKTVFDVGTGATVIYPLLGLKCFGWKFIAS